MSASGGKAENICSPRVFRLLTHLGHWVAALGADFLFITLSRSARFYPFQAPSSRTDAAARIHYASRRRGGLAASSACAANRKNTENWSAVARGSRRGRRSLF